MFIALHLDIKTFYEICIYFWGKLKKNSNMYLFFCSDVIEEPFFLLYMWRVGRGREPWERSEAGGVIGNERHLHRSPVSSPTEELRKG